MLSPPVCVGRAVAKAHLDMALRPLGTRWTVSQDEAGRAELVTRGHGRGPQLIVLEATGGCQRAVVAALAAAAWPVGVGNPRQARDFAKATGQVAKTEARDARALAHVADAIRPPPRPVPEAPTEARRALRARRRPLIARRTAEHTRLGSAPRRLQAAIEAPLPWLAARLAARDDALDPTRRASPVWRAPEERRRRVPGSGPVCARTLGLDLPALGPLTRQRLAALGGGAPFQRDRGTLRGTRRVWGGRAPVRTTWSMRTRLAVRYTPVLKGCYERLCAAGTAKKGARTACMRQRLPILNALVKHHTPWHVQEVPHA
jgi:transposase